MRNVVKSGIINNAQIPQFFILHFLFFILHFSFPISHFPFSPVPSLRKNPRPGSRLRFNTASSFSRQIYQYGKLRHDRPRAKRNAPTGLSQIISAGGFEKSATYYEDERVRRRSPTPIYFTAIALFIIWLLF